MTKNILSSAHLRFPFLASSLINAWFQPMGFTLHLVSNHPSIIAAAETSFGGFGRALPVESPDFTFRFFAHEVDDGPPGQPVFRLEGPLLYQTTGRDSTLTADLSQGLAFGYFSPTTLANPAHFRWHFLELAFFSMLEARGWMGVHSAALVKNGRAALLRARSGGGKTTLAYAGATRGNFQALAEDVVWLDQWNKQWWGLPWSFHLLPDAKKLFPELTAYEPILQTNGEKKLEVNLEIVRPGSTALSARPEAVVWVERAAGEQSRLESFPAELIKELWPLASTGMEMKLPHHPAQLQHLLTCKTYRLYFGDDIGVAVDLLEAVFDA